MCSCSTPPKQAVRVLLDDLPGLQLLDASLPATPQQPRSAHTTYQHNGKSYCLQPSAIGPPQPQQHHEHKDMHPRYGGPPSRFSKATCAFLRAFHASQPSTTSLALAAVPFLLFHQTPAAHTGDHYKQDKHLQHCISRPASIPQTAQSLAHQASLDSWATVCDSCISSLSNKKTPAASLVCIDPGSTAISRHDGQPLPPLTLVESLLVAPLRPMRAVVICKPPGVRQRPNDSFARALRGHVVAFPNPPARALTQCFPQPLDSITELIQVNML